MSYSFFRSHTIERGLEEYEVEAEFEVYSWGCAAQTYGPPENCYPGEGAEIGLLSAWMTPPSWAKGRYPDEAIPFALTDAERWAFEEHVLEHAPPEQDYDDYDD